MFAGLIVHGDNKEASSSVQGLLTRTSVSGSDNEQDDDWLQMNHATAAGLSKIID